MKTIFVSYKYTDELEPVALMIRNWFENHEFNVLDGKSLNASQCLDDQLK